MPSIEPKYRTVCGGNEDDVRMNEDDVRMIWRRCEDDLGTV